MIIGLGARTVTFIYFRIFSKIRVIHNLFFSTFGLLDWQRHSYTVLVSTGALVSRRQPLPAFIASGVVSEIGSLHLEIQTE